MFEGYEIFQDTDEDHRFSEGLTILMNLITGGYFAFLSSKITRQQQFDHYKQSESLNLTFFSDSVYLLSSNSYF